MKQIQKIEKLIFKGNTGRDIIADLSIPINGGKVPVVIFAHGFKGFKDWGHFNLMAEEFARNGLAFLKFNFSHNGGTMDDAIDFPALEAFGENDFIKELADLNTIVEVIHGKGEVLHGIAEWNRVLPMLDATSLSLIGHSRGGGVSLIFSAENTAIKKLVTWNAVSDFGARMPTQEAINKWNKEGVVYIENGRTKQSMPMFYSFYEVYSKNKNRLSISSACEKIRIPVFVVQAEGDVVVPLAEAKSILKYLEGDEGSKEGLIIEGSDHVFGAMHPFLGEALPEACERVISETISFLLKQ